MLRDNVYFLTEKSDGSRYMLYCLAVPMIDKSGGGGGALSYQAVLVDRSGGCYTTIGASLLGESLGRNTVLDGELVFNRRLGRHMYLVS